MHELTTIVFSHFNEKARWALDRFGVPFVEHAYLPMFHTLGVLRLAPRHGLGQRDRYSSRLSTPVLVTDQGVCLRDSSAIVRYVSDRFARPGHDDLYFDPDVAALESRFSDELGPHTRRFAYFHLFTDPPLLHRLAAENVPGQARWFRLLGSVALPAMRRGLGVDAAKAARSEATIRRVVDDVSARIAGRRYLVGDRFSAADLAFASLMSPVLCVRREEGFGASLPGVDACPPDFQRLATDLRHTPAGQHALRMFREERKPRPPVGRDAPEALD